MVVVVQAMGIVEMGAGAAQLPGPLVHQLDKGGYVAAHGLGQDVGRLVGGGEEKTVHQVLHRDDLPRLQVGGGAVGGEVELGGAAHRDHLILGQLAPVDGLRHQQGGHHLCDAGRVGLLPGSLLVEDLTVIGVHQNGMAGGDVGDVGRQGGEGGQQGEGQHKGDQQGRKTIFFHRKILIFMIYYHQRGSRALPLLVRL